MAPLATRAAAPLMQADRKFYGFEDYSDSVFEVREINEKRDPVYLLSAVEELGVATWASEAGLLSTAEELGVFSKLESIGAFSLIEKTLPVVEDLKLLTTFEKLLNVEWSLTFSLAGFILVTGPTLFVLQICGFVPFPSGPLTGAEVLFDLTTALVGGAGLVAAFIISKLQLADANA